MLGRWERLVAAKENDARLEERSGDPMHYRDEQLLIGKDLDQRGA